MCECSICYDTISAATGQVTLACSHVYHLGCVGKWLMEHASCPLCRAEPCDKEKIAVSAEDEEDDYSADDEEEDWGDDRDSIPEFDEEAHAFWVMRTTFERLEQEQTIQPELPVIKEVQEQVEKIRERQQLGSRLAWVMEQDRGYVSA